MDATDERVLTVILLMAAITTPAMLYYCAKAIERVAAALEEINNRDHERRYEERKAERRLDPDNY